MLASCNYIHKVLNFEQRRINILLVGSSLNMMSNLSPTTICPSKITAAWDFIVFLFCFVFQINVKTLESEEGIKS